MTGPILLGSGHLVHHMLITVSEPMQHKLVQLLCALHGGEAEFCWHGGSQNHVLGRFPVSLGCQ